jgi:hypothetical protein
MVEYAKSKEVSGFKADILAENTKMLKVIQQDENVSLKKQPTYGTCEVITMFNRD